MKIICVGYRDLKGIKRRHRKCRVLMKNGPESDAEASSGTCKQCFLEQVKVCIAFAKLNRKIKKGKAT